MWWELKHLVVRKTQHVTKSETLQRRIENMQIANTFNVYFIDMIKIMSKLRMSHILVKC